MVLTYMRTNTNITQIVAKGKKDLGKILLGNKNTNLKT